LDCGSGNNPYPRANILVDLYPSKDSYRLRPLRSEGKAFVQADAHQLPFKNKSFALVICTGTLEYCKNPYQVIRELKRVGKVCYATIPTLLFESLSDLPYHKWYASRKGEFLPNKFYRNSKPDSKSKHYLRGFLLKTLSMLDLLFHILVIELIFE